MLFSSRPLEVTFLLWYELVLLSSVTLCVNTSNDCCWGWKFKWDVRPENYQYLINTTTYETHAAELCWAIMSVSFASSNLALNCEILSPCLTASIAVHFCLNLLLEEKPETSEDAIEFIDSMDSIHPSRAISVVG